MKKKKIIVNIDYEEIWKKTKIMLGVIILLSIILSAVFTSKNCNGTDEKYNNLLTGLALITANMNLNESGISIENPAQNCQISCSMNESLRGEE